jgi:hypothetical protein
MLFGVVIDLNDVSTSVNVLPLDRPIKSRKTLILKVPLCSRTLAGESRGTWSIYTLCITSQLIATITSPTAASLVLLVLLFTCTEGKIFLFYMEADKLGFTVACRHHWAIPNPSKHKFLGF